MSTAEILNYRRWHSMLVSRHFKALFRADAIQLRRDGEIVLADLRDYCFARKSSFHPDALIMARQEGRRDVWLRISNYLNLDEAAVQKLMEIDDGLE